MYISEFSQSEHTCDNGTQLKKRKVTSAPEPLAPSRLHLLREAPVGIMFSSAHCKVQNGVSELVEDSVCVPEGGEMLVGVWGGGFVGRCLSAWVRV